MRQGKKLSTWPKEREVWGFYAFQLEENTYICSEMKKTICLYAHRVFVKVHGNEIVNKFILVQNN